MVYLERYNVNIHLNIRGENVENNYYRRIRELRDDHDYTQKYIAELLGISQPQYCLYEQGKRDLPTDILKKLSAIYQVSADYILEIKSAK